MPVVAPLDRLVVIAAAKQQNLHRQIHLRKLRQPNTLRHPRLLHHQRRARLQRNQQSTSHLETFRQTRFESNHLLINRIDPNDADELRNQTLFAILRMESWTRPKSKTIVSRPLNCSRRGETNSHALRNCEISVASSPLLCCSLAFWLAPASFFSASRRPSHVHVPPFQILPARASSSLAARSRRKLQLRSR